MIAVLMVGTLLGLFVYRQRMQELELANAEVLRAEADLKRADDRVAWSKRPSCISKAQILAEQFGRQKALFTLEKAKIRREVLLNFGNLKNLKALEDKIEELRAECRESESGSRSD